MCLPLFFIFLCSIQVLALWFSNRSSKHLVQKQEDYFLASRQVSFFPLTMTFIAAQIGGGLLLGAADEAYHYGWSVLFYPLGVCLGLVLLGAGISKPLYQLNLCTVAQIFEVKYRSPALRKTASLFSIVSLFMIFVAQLLASKKFLISIGFDNHILFVALWAVVILYTTLGGFRAVISSDLLQASLFIVIFIACFLTTLYHLPNGLETTSLPILETPLIGTSKLFGWLFMPLLFMLIEQDMGQRCFAGNSSKTVTKSALVSAMVIFSICSIPIFFGILAKKLQLVIPTNASVLMTSIQALTNPYLSALFACGIILAIFSTAIALINAISSNLALDFTFFKKDSLRGSKLLTIGVASLGIVFSFYCKNVVDLLIQSYELSVSCLLVSILFALFRNPSSPLPAIFSIVCGGSAFFIFRFFPPVIMPKELFTLFISLGGFCIGIAVERIQRITSSNTI